MSQPASAPLPRAAVAPMSHLDLTFMGSMEECLSRGAKVFSGVLELLERQPDFHFFLEYVLFLEAYRTLHPAQAARLDEYVRAGRVELGAEWSGIFVTSEEEEDLIRNVFYAKQYARERHGLNLETLQLTDIPGVVPQLPQLCAGLGIRNLVLTRCAPPDTLFWYEAPSHDRVLTWSADSYNQAGRFGLHLGTEEARRRGLPARLDWPEPDAPGRPAVPPLFYYGSDLFLPPPELVPTVQAWNEEAGGHHVEITTPTGYFRAVRAAGLADAAPALRGELPSTWLYAEPDHAHVSRWDGIAARALDAAERLSTLAWLRLGLPYPKDELAALWKAQLLARDHNYGGKGAGEGQPRKLAERRNVYDRARRLLSRAAAALAERVETPRECVPVVAFNTLNWSRGGVVRAHVTYYPGVDPARRDVLPAGHTFLLRDPAGKPVPYQVTADRRSTLGEFDLAFVASEVPALGYAAYTLEPVLQEALAAADASAALDAPRQADHPWFQATPPDVVVENGLLRLAVSRSTGRSRLFDLRGVSGGGPLPTGGSGTAAPMPGLHAAPAANAGSRPRLALHSLGLEARHELPEVTLAPPRALSYDDASRETTDPATLVGDDPVAVVEQGLVLTTVAVRQMVNGVPAEVRYTLYRQLPWVDVEVRLDWDVRKFGRVELVYEVPGAAPGAGAPAAVCYGLPFGAGSLAPESLMPGAGPVRGDEAAPASWRQTREIVRWLSVDAPGGGVAMATDHRWTRVDPQEGADGGVAVRCCLVRGGRMRSPAPDTEGDDPRARLVYRFRFVPHAGDWRAAQAPRLGWEAVQPLLSYTVNDTWSPKSLPRSAALATVRSAGAGDALLTCLKQSEDGTAAVARWYEATGGACAVHVDLPGTEAPLRTDLLEQPVPAAGGVEVETEPWRIVTVAARKTD